MLYFLYGTDTQSSRIKLHALLETLAKKRPDAEVFKINQDNWSESVFQELLIAQGLFDQKYIVVLDGLCSNKDSVDTVSSASDDMQKSAHVFLVIDTKVDKKASEALSLYAEKTQEFTLPEKKKEFFNTFALGDALGTQDKKGLWVLYISALEQGISAEEICGVLFWQVKNICIAHHTKNASESKLSPFVDKKARSFAKNFTPQELNGISNMLVDATHKVRQGEGEMEVLLEKTILSLT
jgi:DNA polymerase III delta subunit